MYSTGQGRETSRQDQTRPDERERERGRGRERERGREGEGERERERERGREIDTRTDRQANRQADSDRVRECVQLGCRVSLMTKPTTVTSMIKQRNQTSNEPNVGKTSSEESRERESPERAEYK